MGLLAGFPDIDGAVVGLFRARGGTSVIDVFLQQTGHALNDFWILGLHVLRFPDVGFEIVELNGRQIAHVVSTGAGRAPAPGAWAELQFPFPLADREGAVDRMMHDGLAKGLRVLPKQRGEKTDAVLAGVGGDFGAGDVGGGGEQVGQADGLVAATAGFHLSGPAGNEWHAMSAFVDVGLVSAELVAGIMILGGHLWKFCGGRAAIVGGEDKQRILREIVLLQRLHDLADGPVNLHGEIAIGVDPAFALPFFGREDRSMRGVEGEVDEEGLAGLGVLGLKIKVANDVLGDVRENIDGFKFLIRRAFAVEALFHDFCELRPIVLHVDVGWHIEGGADAEEVVEADRGGSVLHGLGIVDVPAAFVFCVPGVAVIGKAAVLERPIHAEVPFADGSRVVALVLEQSADGHAAGLDQTSGESPADALFESGTPVVASGENAVARRGADRGAGMRVGEGHASLGEFVEVGRLDFAIGVQRLDVAVAHVVREDENDIGPRVGGVGGWRSNGK